MNKKIQDSARYEQYKNITISLRGESYSGVPLEKLVAFFVADFVYNYFQSSLLCKAKMLIKYLFLVPRVQLPDDNARAVFGWSIQRGNYKKLSDAYKEKLGNKFSDVCVNGSLVGWKLKFNAQGFVKSIRFARRASLCSIRFRLIMFVSVRAGINFLNYLEENFNGELPDRYLSFNSSFQYEAVLTLFYRYKNVKTYSMQHGMYCKFRNEIPFDMISSYFCAAENFLLWGRFSKDEVSEFLPKDTNLIVFGNPLYDVSFDNMYSDVSNKILVGLPRELYLEEISELLKIIRAPALSSFHFTLRLHPGLDRDIFSANISGFGNITISDKETLNDDVANDQYRAFIGFNSTVLFEATNYGLPILQFRSGNDEFYNVGFFEFTGLEELKQILQLNLSLNKDLGFYFHK